MYLVLEVGREADGRFIAEVTDLPGVLAYGERRMVEVLCRSARYGAQTI